MKNIEQDIPKILATLSPRWRRLFRFQWETGCRVSEALNLTWACVDGGQGEIVSFVPHPLPNGQMWRPKRPASVRKIRLETPLGFKGPENELVFFKGRDKPMCYHTARNQLRKAAKLAGVELKGTHDLRRARITTALQGDCSVHQLSRYVGHASVRETIRYCIRDPEVVLSIPPSWAPAVDNAPAAEWAQVFRPRAWSK